MKKGIFFNGRSMRMLLLPVLFLTLFSGIVKSQTSCFNPEAALRRVASSFHSTIMIDYKGEVMYWGDGASISTSSSSPHVLIPTRLTDFTGTPIAVAGGSLGPSNFHQLYLLTTTNLYGWGYSNGTITSTTANVGISTIALPAGVNATDIVAIEAAAGGLAIVTSVGHVYIKQEAKYLGSSTGNLIRQYTSAIYGRGGTVVNTISSGSATTNNTSMSAYSGWQRVLTAANTPLTNIAKVSFSQLGVMALSKDGKVYTWGHQVSLGNSTAAQDLAFATEMTLPAAIAGSVSVVDININTKTYVNNQVERAVHYLVASNGRVYALGEGYGGSLGQNTTTEGSSAVRTFSNTWLTVKRATTGSPEINNATMITTSNAFILATSGSGYSAGVLTTDGEALLWGVNHYDMLGNSSAIGSGYRYVYGARQPANISSNADIKYGFIEMGGHTTIAFLKESTKYCYLGHLVRGSMGDGTNDDDSKHQYDCFSTAAIYYCDNSASEHCPVPSAKDLIASSSLGTTLLDNHSSVFAWGANAHPYSPASNDVALYGSIPSDYLSGVPVGLAAGTVVSGTTQNSQFWLHSTGGIYGWGYSANTIVDATTGQVAITLLTLPAGLTIQNVSFIRSAKGGIALVTTTGEVWIKGGTASSLNFNVYGDASTALNSAWHQVKINSTTNLAGVVELSFAGTNAMALTSLGTVYAWGSNVYTGTGSPLSAAAARNYATPVAVPSGIEVKTVEILHSATTTNASQFLLTRTGLMYSVGDNSNGILGIGSTTAQTTWQQVSSASGTLLTGVTKISSTNHTAGANGMAALTLNNNVYTWGNNSAATGYRMLSNPTNGNVTYATLATSGSGKSNVELGGQFSLFFERGSNNIMFTGNNSRGSAGTTAIASGTVTTSSNAIAISNCAGDVYTISGSILNDKNGLVDNLVNGSAITTSTLHAVLLDPSGLVLESKPLSGTGAFEFANYMSANYSVRITATAGTVGQAAPAAATSFTVSGEEYVLVSQQIGNVANEGIVSNTANTAISLSRNFTNVNFGYDMRPKAVGYTSATIGNPGIGNFYTVPNSFIPATDTDGGVTAIRITAFPTNATNITLNGVTYTNGATCYNSNGCTTWPATGGVTVPYTGGAPTNPIHIYPNTGNTDASFNYVALDEAGVQSTSAATVVIQFRTINLSGTVFHDANNNRIKEASEAVYTAANVTAVLVDPSGRVIEKVAVAANGNYTLTQVPLSTTGYKVILTAEPFSNITLTATAPVSSNPSNWTYTGSNVNSGSTSATVSINIPSSGTTLSGYNFGAQQIPTANTKTWTASRDQNGDIFKGGNYYRLGLSDGEDVRLTGTDPEDGAKGSGSTFRILSLPPSSLAVLYYEDNNGVKQPITINQTITNYDPAKMFVRFIADASVFSMAQFTYAVVDNAGAQSPAVNYTISMPTALPAIGLELSLSNTATGTVLNWNTVSETNTKHFIVERSIDGTNYKAIATVAAAGNSNINKNYSATDVDNNYTLAYYRIVLVDLDNKKSISNVVINRLNGNGSIVSVYPNPAKGNTKLEFSKQGNYSILVLDATGKLVQTHQLNAVNGSLFNVHFKSKGLFIIKVTGNQTEKTFKVISE